MWFLSSSAVFIGLTHTVGINHFELMAHGLAATEQSTGAKREGRGVAGSPVPERPPPPLDPVCPSEGPSGGLLGDGEGLVSPSTPGSSGTGRHRGGPSSRLLRT